MSGLPNLKLNAETHKMFFFSSIIKNEQKTFCSQRFAFQKLFISVALYLLTNFCVTKAFLIFMAIQLQFNIDFTLILIPQ